MSTQTKLPTLAEKVDAAFRQAAHRVIEKARQTGTPVIVWEDGRVVEYSAEEMMARLSQAEAGDKGREGASESPEMP